MRRAHVAVAALTLSMLALPSCKGERPGAVAGAEATDSALPDTLCANPAQWNQLCSTIPHEVMVTLGGDYHGLAPATQTRFDAFSWQSFVALNWPSDGNGNPLPGSFTDNPGAPRVWEGWTNAVALFQSDSTPGPCASMLARGGTRKVLMQMAKNGQVVNPHATFDEAVGGPLLDRNLNFALFEKVLSPDETQYIRDSSLVTVAGQEAIDTINFPPGFYADAKLMTGGQVGSMEVKAAWRILQPASGDDSTRYYHQQALIAVPAENSASGQAFCISATVGLVGLHIIHKTKDFPAWVWSTFEQEDNAPTCTGSGGSCGTQDTTTRWSFFNAACTTCQVNQPLRDTTFLKDSTFIWNTSPPYGSRYATNGQYGSQITRTEAVYVPTDSMNALWHSKIPSSVWSHYRLIGSQWQAIVPGFPKNDTSNAPPILGNSALESFIPKTSDCIGCHTFATTAGTPSKFADFSFVLGLAGQPPSMMAPFFLEVPGLRRGARPAPVTTAAPAARPAAAPTAAPPPPARPRRR